MSLTSLPPELFSNVVANIKSLPTLCNLARCSRQLYLCTIPHLYRHVTVKDRVRRGDRQNGQLKNIASLLVRRPDLAELVRNFTLHAAGPFWTKKETSEESEAFEHFENPEEPGEYGSSENVDVDQTLKTTVTAWNLSEEKVDNRLKQLSRTDKDHRDSILALLLPVLLKAEKLVLDLKFGFHTHYLERIIRRAAHRERPFDNQLPFQSLKVFVHLPDHDYPYQQSISIIASLLKFPAIQEISATFGDIFEADIGDHGKRETDVDLVKLDSSSSSLTSLDLTACTLTEDLHHMLRAPKALKTFSYKILPPDGINFVDIRHALEPQKNSLESLRLGFGRDYGPMASFISFNKLKFFKITALFLALTDNVTQGHGLIDTVPPNLETLHVTGVQECFPELVEAIDELLEEKSPHQIPLLKTLILEETKTRLPMDTRLVDAHKIAIGRLSRVAAAHEVSLDILEIERRIDE